MRKQVFGRKFKRHANARHALLKGLMADLVLKEKITTTEEKAKAIKGQVEKLVTKAKTKGQNAKRLLQPFLPEKAVEKVLTDLAKRFASRPGGYTRVVKLGERFGDNARMAIIEWVVGPEDREQKTEDKEKKKANSRLQKPKNPQQPKNSKEPTKKSKEEKKTAKKK